LHLADDLALLVFFALLGSSSHLKCQTHRLKLCGLLTFQLRANMLESPDSFLRIQSLSATKANLGWYCQDGSMNSTPQDLFYLFLHKFATTNRALFKWQHDYLLRFYLAASVG
jgi:hypothetical protein